MVISSRFRISPSVLTALLNRRGKPHSAVSGADADGTLCYRFAKARKNIHVVLTLKALFGIVLRHLVFASVSSYRWTNEASTLVGQVVHQRHGSALQSVLRFPRGCRRCFTTPPTNGCCCQCPWNVFGPCRYPSVGCPPITRFAAHGLSECATETWFFSLRLCVLYAQINNNRHHF